MNDTLKKLKLFESVVGQQSVKEKLSFFLDAYMHTHIFPHSIFHGAKGMGKTTLVREVGKGLVEFDENGKIRSLTDESGNPTGKPKRKRFIEVNAAGVKNVKDFINNYLIKHVQNKDVTVFIDEVAKLDDKTQHFLLSMLNPNPEHRTVSTHDDYSIDIDFRRQTFLLATAEPQKVNYMLRDRLRRFDLEDYTYDQMQKILQKCTPGVVYNDDVLPEIASVLRGNARAAQMMGEDIISFLKGKDQFGKNEWKQLKEVFSIHPLGLTNTELSILRLLSNRSEGTPLAALAAMTELTREALQKDYEMYLQKHHLIEIVTKGRKITSKGLEYLRDLDKVDRPSFRSKCVIKS